MPGNRKLPACRNILFTGDFDRTPLLSAGVIAVTSTLAVPRATIPSFLAAALSEKFYFKNLGERGFNVAQELNRFIRVVSEGDIPDVQVLISQEEK